MNKVTFKALKLDEAGTLNYFETDQAETDTPTLTIKTAPSKVKKGRIRRVHYRLNPTNAVTYDLYIFMASKAGNYESEAMKVFDSNDVIADSADDAEYDGQLLDVPFYLEDDGLFYYIINWSGAPGNTTGYIVVEGEVED